MPDVFITLEEAAAFEGITYEAMKKRVQRSPEQHNVKSQAREGGGKDQVLISTSSLSAKARKAWRAAQKVEGSEVIVLEALTQPGDVFYDAEFGWGLYDFIQSEDTELTRLEITQRVRLKLQKREVILPESIEISIAFEDDAVVLHCSFRFAEEDERHELDVIIGAVSVEVVSE